jgi:hypothetical protein
MRFLPVCHAASPSFTLIWRPVDIKIKAGLPSNALAVQASYLRRMFSQTLDYMRSNPFAGLTSNDSTHSLAHRSLRSIEMNNCSITPTSGFSKRYSPATSNSGLSSRHSPVASTVGSTSRYSPARSASGLTNRYSPTQYLTPSSPSPAFSDYDAGRSSARGLHQAAALPLNHLQPFVLSPLSNLSRSTIGSTASSYHTCEADKQDRTKPLVARLESQPPWHDLCDTRGELSSAADGDVEEIVQQHSGLEKGDFVVIQEQPFAAAKLKAEEFEPRERRNSHRKRRPLRHNT